MGNRQIAPSAPSGNRSAFGGVRDGGAARAHSDHGYSSLGPAERRRRRRREAEAAAVVAAAGAVAGTDRSGGKNHGKNEFNLPQQRSVDVTRFVAVGLAISAGLLQAAPNQRTFATPMEAIQATIDAAEHNDTAALLQLFGPDGKDIFESGDPAQDKDLRAEFARSAHEKLQIEQDPTNPDRVTFAVGEQDWPFPVPVSARMENGSSTRQRKAGDSGPPGGPKRTERHGGLPGLRRGSTRICLGRPRP